MTAHRIPPLCVPTLTRRRFVRDVTTAGALSLAPWLLRTPLAAPNLYSKADPARMVGQTANFARRAGESTGDVRFVFGIRTWF